MAQTKTKEQVDYEKALKNIHELSLRKALSEEGIDTSKMPRKKFDDFRRLVDSIAQVKQKYHEIITTAQQQANAIITKAQQDAAATIAKVEQDMQTELQEIQKGIEGLVKQIKVEQGIIKPEPEAEAKPEVVEIEEKKEPEQT